MVAIKLDIYYWRLWIRFLRKGNYLVFPGKFLIKTICQKGNKSKYSNYKGIRSVSLGCKLLSMMIPLRLWDAIDEGLRKVWF